MSLPTLLAAAADDSAVVVAIVASRLLVPLLIPRIPLAIVAALVIDAVDQTVLAALTEIDTSETGPYQSYDKALDVYYLTIAYLSTIRNWTSEPAFRIGQFLFLYRLVGTTLFELTHERSLLLVFPNTFEYYFIVYELIRLRYEPTRFSTRFWIGTAAVIWVGVKLPQEYWIHVAQRDFTEAVADYPLFGLACILGALGALAVFLFVLRPRLPAPDWGLRFAAQPLERALVEPSARYSSRMRRGILSLQLFEQVGLLALLCVIFSQILPGTTATPLQTAVGVTGVVLGNTAITLWVALRGGVGTRSGALLFLARLVVNYALVASLSRVVADGDVFPLGHGLFFAYLITLVTWLYDWYRPLYEERFRRLV